MVRSALRHAGGLAQRRPGQVALARLVDGGEVDRLEQEGRVEAAVGGRAEDLVFTLKAIGLKEHSLRDYRGRNVVLLFYPLDWTPG